MYQQVTFNDFRKAFHDMNRGNNFTLEGLRALFDYIEQYEDDTGENIELDVIGLCCDYAQFSAGELAELGLSEDDAIAIAADDTYIIQQ